MKKTLLKLAITLTLSSTAFSQTDTLTKDSVVVIPTHIAKQIVKDLLLYDGCREELDSTIKLLSLTDEKVKTQSLLFQEKQKQYTMCRSQVDATEQKVNLYLEANKNLTAKNNRLKRTTKVLGVTSGVSIALVAILLLVK
mgnify:FL=1|tara:strand:+ start:424 stop:843 length:420 start_codon:yes stop_codon:yes gene_type:complete